MTRLNLSVAVGDYDRTRPLWDGTVPIDGVDPTVMLLEPEEIFFRAFRHEAFDIAELSLASFSVKAAGGDNPYVGIPAFPSRSFRHSGIYIRKDRGIKTPSDLKGRKVGLAEYQLTANVWIRALLDDEYGVAPSDIQWVRGGIEQPGRPEKLAIELPADVRIADAPPNMTLSQMLLAGEIDALIGPRTPSVMTRENPHIGWLFDDPRQVATEYFKKTGNFPIMHLVGIRRSLVERHAWLPGAVLKAFFRAKDAALTKLLDTAASKVMLPFVDQYLADAQSLLGHDHWSYGYPSNRTSLHYFLAQHHKQGLSQRMLDPADLFHPSTLEMARI